jgi:hypothetical protein
MKKSELKNLIKPIVDECIRETVLESGLVSNIVAEVMKGVMPVLKEVATKPVAREHKTNPLAVEEDYFIPAKKEEKRDSDALRQLRESHRATIEEIAGKKKQNLELQIGGINIFDGVDDHIPSDLTEEKRATAGALADADPRDPGVNLAAFGIKGKMRQIK